MKIFSVATPQIGFPRAPHYSIARRSDGFALLRPYENDVAFLTPEGNVSTLVPFRTYSRNQDDGKNSIKKTHCFTHTRDGGVLIYDPVFKHLVDVTNGNQVSVWKCPIDPVLSILDLFDKGVLIAGPHQGKLLHIVDRSGEILESFAPIPSARRDLQHLNSNDKQLALLENNRLCFLSDPYAGIIDLWNLGTLELESRFVGLPRDSHPIFQNSSTVEILGEHRPCLSIQYPGALECFCSILASDDGTELHAVFGDKRHLQIFDSRLNPRRCVSLEKVLGGYRPGLVNSAILPGFFAAMPTSEGWIACRSDGEVWDLSMGDALQSDPSEGLRNLEAPFRGFGAIETLPALEEASMRKNKSFWLSIPAECRFEFDVDLSENGTIIRGEPAKQRFDKESPPAVSLSQNVLEGLKHLRFIPKTVRTSSVLTRIRVFICVSAWSMQLESNPAGKCKSWP